MEMAAKLDDIGRDIPKPILILGMIFGFIWWWPVGLTILFFMLWSKRMGWHRGYACWGGRWHNNHSGEDAARRRATGPSSGNWAFDEYRAETLKRLEDEQQEFRDFLERLRHAKDKAEFDQFMAERRRPQAPDAPPAA